MPRSLLWPDPRVKPPYGVAEIDWSHQLARGLGWGWLLEDTLTNVDIVRGARVLGLSAGTSPIVYGDSLGLKLSGAGSAAYTVRDASMSQVELSVVARVALTAAGSYPMIFSANNGTNGFELRCEASSGHLGFQINAIGFAAEGATNITSTGFRSVAGTWRSSENVRTYVDGKQDGSGGGGGVTLSSTSSPWAIGSRSGGTFPFAGTLDHVYIYLVELTPSEVLWHAAEPYAMLRPIVRRRYFVPAGAVALSLADTATLGLQEAAGVTAGFRLSDVAALGVNEADALLATLTAADAVALGVLDTEALLARLTLADLSAMGLTDVASILGGMTVSDAVALGIIDRETILAQIPLADVAALGLDEVLLLRALLTDLSDALGVGIQESVSVAQAMALALSDTFGLTMIEALTLGVSAVLADTVAINAEDMLDLLSTFTVSDGTALTAADALSLLARFSIGDTAALGLQDSVALLEVALQLADSCGLGLAEAVTVTAGLLLADSCGLTLAEVLDILKELAPALLLFDRPVRLLGGDDRRVALVGGDDRRVALVGS